MFRRFLIMGVILLSGVSLCLMQSKLLVSSEPADEYWLGVWCSPVPAALRAQLSLAEKQGVLVESVAPDSPAQKAGIARFDILLRINDTSITEPQDLKKAIEAAKDTKVKIEILREGKQKTVEVTLAKRPAKSDMPAGQQADDWQTVEKWIQSFWPWQDGNGKRPPMRFRMLHPGAIVPRDAIPGGKMPANLSISISKEGDQPAKIVVKRDNDRWELTENDLEKLPADIRPHVERLLGRGLMGVVGSADALEFVPKMPSFGGENPLDAEAWHDRIEKRMAEMNSRIERMMKKMDELFDLRDKQEDLKQPAEESQK